MKLKTYQKILTPILSAALIASLTPTLALAAPTALEAAQIEGVATENAPDNAKGESVDGEGVSEQGFSEQTGWNNPHGEWIKNPAEKISNKSLNMIKAFKKRFVTGEFKANFDASSTYWNHYKTGFTGGYTQAAQKKLFNEFQSAQVKPKGWDGSKKKVDLSKLDTTCSSKADLLITWAEANEYNKVHPFAFIKNGSVGYEDGVEIIDISRTNRKYQQSKKINLKSANSNNRLQTPFITRALYNDEISKVVRTNPLQKATNIPYYQDRKGKTFNIRSIDANELGLYNGQAGHSDVKIFSQNRHNESKVRVAYFGSLGNVLMYSDGYIAGLNKTIGADMPGENIKFYDEDHRYGCIRWGYSYTDKAGREHKGVWELYEGVDYVIEDHGKDKYIPGKYKIEIIGKGRFTGKIEFTYNVGKLDLGYDMKQSDYGSSASLLLGYFGNSNTVGISNAQAETALKKDLKKKNIKSLNGIVWKQFGEHDYRLVLTKTAKMHLKKSLYFKCLQNEDKSKPYAKKLKTKIKIKKLFIPSRYKKYVSYNKKADVLILKKGVINPFGALAKIKIEVSSPYISGDLFKNKKTYTTEYGWYIWMGRAWDCDTYELSFTNKNRVINY